MERLEPDFTIQHSADFKTEVYALQQDEFLRFTSKRNWVGPGVVLRQIHRCTGINDVEYFGHEKELWEWVAKLKN